MNPIQNRYNMNTSTLLLGAVVAVILAQLFLLWQKNRRFWKLLYAIPGPPGLPIIGNLFDLMNSPENMFLQDRERALKYYPIYKMNIINLGAVDIINPDDIELVVTNMKHNKKSTIYDLLNGWLGTGLLTSAGSKWQKRRKILTPAFHFNILQEFLTIFNEETKRLVEDLETQCHEAVDVVPPITQFALLSIGETAMGTTLGQNDQEKTTYKDAIYRIGHLLTQRATRPWLFNDSIYGLTKEGKEQNKLIEHLHKFSNGIIQERKKVFGTSSYSKRKRMAMLDLLLTYKANGADIDDEGIREEVDTFMFEGHDTTSMAICFTLMLLANHKDVQQEVYQEIIEVLGDSDEFPSFNDLGELKYMERVIKESLRLYPSVPFISRISGEEFTTHTGYTIPNECMMNIYIYDMHHNPNVFPDPEKFDPDRFLPENTQNRHPFAYLPFSAGPRNCIGQKYAILEMKAVLSGILKKFVLEQVDRPEDIKFIADMVLRPKGSVKVKFLPRKMKC